jgi:predicted phage tail protein
MHTYGNPARKFYGPVEIRFYGHLRKRFGKGFKMVVQNAGEAIRALTFTLPGFAKYVGETHSEPGYKVVVGDTVLPLDKDIRHLGRPVGRQVIKIIPHVAGSKSGGMGIILGIAMIAFGVMTGGAGLGIMAAYAGPGGLLAAAGSFAFTMGVSLVLGGIGQLMAKSPESPGPANSPENKPSYAFNGAVNTIAQGNPVPLFYGGPAIIGSQVISAGISTAQLLPDSGTTTTGSSQTPPPTDAPGNVFGDVRSAEEGGYEWWNGSSWQPGMGPSGGPGIE